MPTPRHLLIVPGLLALVVRLAWVPTWSRLRFDGHERLYLAAFEGSPPDPSLQANPVLCALYQALGLLTHDPRALVVLSAVAGASMVLAVSLWTERRLGLRAGLWAGALVAVLGEHAAWSTSPFNVMLPNALLAWGFVAGRWSGVLIALATCMRPDLVLAGLLRGWPGLGGAAGVAMLLVLGGLPPGDPLAALGANLPMVRFLGPPVLLGGALLALAVPRARTLVGAVLLLHLGGALFADYGARHGLFGATLLCIAVAALSSRRWGSVVACGVLVGLCVETAEISRIWHARPIPPALSADLPPLPAGCVEVSEEPPIPGQALPSHLSFRQGEIEADCVVWGEESQHYGWSSRNLRDRARRMRTLYHLEPIARWDPGDPSRARVYHRLTRRWP